MKLTARGASDEARQLIPVFDGLEREMRRLTRVARVDGVDVYFHWSTFVLGGLLAE